MKRKTQRAFLLILTLVLVLCLSMTAFAEDSKDTTAPVNIMDIQTDFCVKDSAVSAMKGLAVGVDTNLNIKALEALEIFKFLPA